MLSVTSVNNYFSVVEDINFLFFNRKLFVETQQIHYILQVKALREVLQIVNLSGLFEPATYH